MKILLYCLPRTRSSLLQDVLSQHYNIENLFEPYKKAEALATKTMFLTPENIGKLFKKEIIEISNKLVHKQDCIVKIFPCHTYNSYQLLWEKEPNIAFQEENIYDLEKIHYISNYNKIFVLKRKNLVEAMASYWFAYERGQFIFTKQNKFFIPSFVPKKKIKLDIPYKWLKVHYMDSKILEYHAAWMKKHNIDFTELYYEDITEYIAQNYPNYDSKFIETNFDYKNMIDNYNEILEKIERAKSEVDADFEKLLKNLLSQ